MCPLAGQFVESNTGSNRYDAARSAREFASFREEEEAKERAKLEKSLQPLTVLPTDTSQAMRVHQFEMTELWSSPLVEIQAAMNGGKWESLYWLIHLREDSEPRIRQTEQEAFAEFQKYCAALTGRTGFKLNPDGAERLSKLICVELRCGKIEVTQETIDAALDVMLRNHVFSEGEVEYDANWKTASPTTPVDSQPVTADVFEDLNLTGSEEEARIGKRIAQHLFDKEFRPVVLRWVSSLWERFRYELAQVEADAVKNWMERFNRPRTFASLEQCRVAFVKAGMFPEKCLTHDDLKTVCIEKLPSDDKEALRIVLHGTLPALKELMQRKGISAL